MIGLFREDAQQRERKRRQQQQYKEDLDAQVNAKNQQNPDKNFQKQTRNQSQTNYPVATKQYEQSHTTNFNSTFQDTFKNDIVNYTLPIRVARPNQLQQKLTNDISNIRSNSSCSPYVAPLTQVHPVPTFKDDSKFSNASFTIYKPAAKSTYVQDPKGERINHVNFNFIHGMKMEVKAAPISSPPIVVNDVEYHSRVSTPTCGFSVHPSPYKFKSLNKQQPTTEKTNDDLLNENEDDDFIEKKGFPNDLPMF